MQLGGSQEGASLPGIVYSGQKPVSVKPNFLCHEMLTGVYFAK